MSKQRLCEWCHEQPWTGLYDPDGLGGHETLVCDDCLRTLTEPALEVRNYRARDAERGLA